VIARVAALVLASFICARAEAQDAPDAGVDCEDTYGGDAQAAFAAGERAFADPDYEAALEHFRCAFALAPHDVVRFNIAVCYDRLSRFREAIEEYRSAAESSEVDEGARARAREQVAELRGRLGTIRFPGWPDGGSVSVDGEARCSLPCELEEDPGAHVVVVRIDGVESIETVEVARGGTHVVTRPPAPSPVVDPPSPPDVPDETSGIDLGWLTWVGVGVGAVGTGLTIGFGVRAADLHDQYFQPGVASLERSQEGNLMVTLTNVFLSVAATGPLLVLLDLFLQTGE
jgi:hypothetical protein